MNHLRQICGWSFTPETHYFWCGNVMAYPPTLQNVQCHVENFQRYPYRGVYVAKPIRDVPAGVLVGFAELNYLCGDLTGVAGDENCESDWASSFLRTQTLGESGLLTATVQRVLINPELRGFGYGQELMKMLEEEAAASGLASKMQLVVSEVNETAVAVYRKRGFTVEEVFCAADRPWNKYVMVKELF